MSKINMTNGKAMAKGYTRFAIAESDGETVRVLIREDADLSGMVACWDTEAQCWIELNAAFWEFTDDTLGIFDDCEVSL